MEISNGFLMNSTDVVDVTVLFSTCVPAIHNIEFFLSTVTLTPVCPAPLPAELLCTIVAQPESLLFLPLANRWHSVERPAEGPTVGLLLSAGRITYRLCRYALLFLWWCFESCVGFYSDYNERHAKKLFCLKWILSPWAIVALRFNGRFGLACVI